MENDFELVHSVVEILQKIIGVEFLSNTLKTDST
jgi:hypothetical protein